MWFIKTWKWFWASLIFGWNVFQLRCSWIFQFLNVDQVYELVNANSIENEITQGHRWLKWIICSIHCALIRISLRKMQTNRQPWLYQHFIEQSNTNESITIKANVLEMDEKPQPCNISNSHFCLLPPHHKSHHFYLANN